MKNESIFQRKRKKFFPFVYQDLFHFHTFIHFFLSCWRNEIPKDIFFLFLFNGMESKFTFGVIIFIASDRSEFQKWKIEIERSKKDVRNFGYKSFFSISPSHFFYLWGLFLSLLRRQGKKFRVFLDVTTCIRCHFEMTKMYRWCWILAKKVFLSFSVIICLSSLRMDKHTKSFLFEIRTFITAALFPSSHALFFSQ